MIVGKIIDINRSCEVASGCIVLYRSMFRTQLSQVVLGALDRFNIYLCGHGLRHGSERGCVEDNIMVAVRMYAHGKRIFRMRGDLFQ